MDTRSVVSIFLGLVIISSTTAQAACNTDFSLFDTIGKALGIKSGSSLNSKDCRELEYNEKSGQLDKASMESGTDQQFRTLLSEHERLKIEENVFKSAGTIVGLEIENQESKSTISRQQTLPNYTVLGKNQ
jgi:hypothetical protein